MFRNVSQLEVRLSQRLITQAYSIVSSYSAKFDMPEGAVELLK